MKKIRSILIVLAIVALGLSIAVGKSILSSSGEREASDKVASSWGSNSEFADDTSSVAVAALRQAAEVDKYLFAFFWKTENEQSTTMRKVFEATVRKMEDRAQSVVVCVTDPSEKRIVEKFGLDRAPMPLVLALAPNGAVMGGFPTKFTEEELLDAFGSPCTEQCMKALQDNKLVLLCVQNGATKSNSEAARGVREFKADTRYSKATEIVMLDPADPEEASFLADLKIDPKESEATTAFLVPPGSVIAEFKGATDKGELIAALQKANTSCGPGGCGPEGCGPKK
jgi:hypothetical protein